ncbi:MAG: flippase-like domain-containing protein [Candidatus Altiarchaeota archaeon]
MIALIIIAALVNWFGPMQMIRALEELSLAIFFMAFVVSVGSHVLRLKIWQLLLRKKYGFSQLATAYLSSRIAVNLAPGRVGEFSPLIFSRYRNREVSSVILLIRLLEAYTTLFLGFLGFLFLGITDPSIIYGWVFVVIVVSIVLFFSLNLGFWRKINVWFKDRRYLGRLSEIFMAVSESTISHKRFAIPLLVLGFGAKLMDLFMISLFFKSVSLDVSLPLIAAVYCIISILSIVSITPGGVGLADAPGLYMLNIYGVPLPQLGVVYAMMRLVPMLATGPFFFAAYVFKEKGLASGGRTPCTERE